MREVEPRHEHRSWQPDIKNFLSYARCSSLSRYSLGTSSSGISCVITSATSGSLAFSTPYMAFASNALPSSANSSTLSESAIGCPKSVESLPLVQRSQAPFPCVFFDHASSCFFFPAARPSFCDSLTAYKRDCTIGTLSRRSNMNLSARLRNRQTNLDPQPGRGKPCIHRGCSRAVGDSVCSVETITEWRDRIPGSSC